MWWPFSKKKDSSKKDDSMFFNPLNNNEEGASGSLNAAETPLHEEDFASTNSMNLVEESPDFKQRDFSFSDLLSNANHATSSVAEFAESSTSSANFIFSEIPKASFLEESSFPIHVEEPGATFFASQPNDLLEESPFSIIDEEPSAVYSEPEMVDSLEETTLSSIDEEPSTVYSEPQMVDSLEEAALSSIDEEPSTVYSEPQMVDSLEEAALSSIDEEPSTVYSEPQMVNSLEETALPDNDGEWNTAYSKALDASTKEESQNYLDLKPEEFLAKVAEGQIRIDIETKSRILLDLIKASRTEDAPSSPSLATAPPVASENVTGSVVP